MHLVIFLHCNMIASCRHTETTFSYFPSLILLDCDVVIIGQSSLTLVILCWKRYYLQPFQQGLSKPRHLKQEICTEPEFQFSQYVFWGLCQLFEMGNILQTQEWERMRRQASSNSLPPTFKSITILLRPSLRKAETGSHKVRTSTDRITLFNMYCES